MSEASPSTSAGEVAALRRVEMEGAANVRDIGGRVTSDGGVVRTGLVFRADTLSSLTDGDVTRLAGLGVRTVVDFRGEGEVSTDGPDRLPDGCVLVRTPLLEESTELRAGAMMAAFRTGDIGRIEEMLGGRRARQFSESGLTHQLRSPTTVAKYAATLRLVAGADAPVLYHCTSGKDRTGLMTALLLGLLGVPEDVIVADYLYSNECNRARNERTLARIAAIGVDPELMRPLLVQREGQILPVLERVRETGGWRAFAEQVLDLDGTTVDALRGRLVTTS